MRWKVFLGIFFLILLGVTFAYIVGESPSEVYIFNFQIFANSFDGNTTNFSLYNETHFSNLSSVILERNLYGNITFQENLDLISMAGTDGIINFDRDVNISDNFIFVDNYYLPGIDKSVILSLYGLDFDNPIIYHNGVICSNCNLIRYYSGNISFTSPSFSGVYYIREEVIPPSCGDDICNGDETCNSCSEDCGSCPPDDEEEEEPPSGGEIPGEVTGEYDFFVAPTYFSVEMGKGTYYSRTLTVVNNGTRDVPISIFVDGVQDFVFPEARGFILKVGESKDIKFDIYVSDKRVADVYVGKILFKYKELERKVNVVMDVKEREALFDIKTETLKKYINPGGRIRANVSLVNMGHLRNFDVSLEYMMIDFDKNEYVIKKEDFAINQSYSRVFYLDVPENVSVGRYLFYTRVSYKDVNASSYDTFTVEKVSGFSWIILILIILLLMYLVYRWYKEQKKSMAEKYERSLIKKKSEEEVSGNLPNIKKETQVPELP